MCVSSHKAWLDDVRESVRACFGCCLRRAQRLKTERLLIAYLVCCGRFVSCLEKSVQPIRNEVGCLSVLENLFLNPQDILF